MRERARRAAPNGPAGSGHRALGPARSGLPAEADPAWGVSLKELVDAFERGLIEVALAGSKGSQIEAAETLGLLPTTLHQKMRRLGIPTARNGRGGAARERRGSRKVELSRGEAARTGRDHTVSVAIDATSR